MRSLWHTLIVLSLFAVLAASMQAAELTRSISSNPPSAASAVADSPQEMVCRSGDNPLTPYYSWCGTGGVVIDVIGDTVQSGTFRVSEIPAGATIIWAHMYEASWEPKLYNTPSAVFMGTTLPSVQPFDYDSTGTGGYVLCAYRWDVTSLVSGNGDYDYSVSPLSQTYGEALVVVYRHASEPVRKILVNDGSEALEFASSSTAFACVQDDSARLCIFTQADDTTGEAEAVHFNDAVLAGPGDVFHMNRGIAASLLEFSVRCTTGTNTVTCVTDKDYFGWHLAILETYRLAVKVTGGGWFAGGRAGSGSKKTFGFNVRSDQGFCRGQLQFNDHSLGVKVHSDSLRSLSVYADTTASFTGSCSVNKTSGYSFECTVTDRGEPGRNADSFHLKIYDAEENICYSEGGLLGGGNIQIHVGGDHEATADHSAPDGEPDSPQAPIPSVQHDVRGKNKVHPYIRNSPNPFCDRTEISYCLPAPGRITLDIYDVTGEHVESLVDEMQAAGTHTVRWDVRNRGCGVYFCKLRLYPERDEFDRGQNRSAAEFIETRKMVVVD